MEDYPWKNWQFYTFPGPIRKRWLFCLPIQCFYICKTCFLRVHLSILLITLQYVQIGHCTHWQMSKQRGIKWFYQSHVSCKWKSHVQCYSIVCDWLGFSPRWLPTNLFPCCTHKVKTPYLSMFEIFFWFNIIFLSIERNIFFFYNQSILLIEY